MRSGLIGLLAAGGLGLCLIVGWNWPASLSAATEEGTPWQIRELLFLKAAYDRMQDDLARDPEGRDTLRAERDRVVRQMAETAKLAPPDDVPAEIRRLLASSQELPQVENAALTTLIETVAIQEYEPELRAGLGPSAPPGIDFSEFAIDPGIRQPIVDMATSVAKPAGSKPRPTKKPKPRGRSDR